MVAYLPSAHDGYIPDHESTGKLVVDFSRNVKDFALPNYTQIVPVQKMDGRYLEMTVEEAGRILNTDLAEFDWPDGAVAPRGFDNTEYHEFKAYRCKRRAYPTTLGDLTLDQASWDMAAQYQAIRAQQAMTARTQAVITEFTTSGNYASSHTSAVASISGNTGNWAASTTARQDIKRSLIHAVQVIEKDTLSAVAPDQFILVISPGCAKSLAVSQEIVDYIKGSPDAWAWVKGDLSKQNRNIAYGLPPTLYGFDVYVERTVKVTSRKGATTARSYVLPDATPFMCARVGGLEGKWGPSFSTVSLMMMEEMTVENLKDKNNRLTDIRVVENYDVVMTAPATGFLFTSAV